MQKRLAATGAVAAIYVAVIWFTAWDRSPALWAADTRFVVAAVGMALTLLAVTFPFED